MPGLKPHTLLLLLGLLASPTAMAAEERVDSEHWTNDYDGHFKKYTKRYFGPHFDWHWFKAQGIAESGLRSNVTSHAGARGVMQILPTTYDEIKDKNPHFRDISKPRWNIAAGIYYDRQLYRRWNTLTEPERLYTVFASYNAGYNRIRRIYQRLNKSDSKWQHIHPRLPKETRGYVKRIRKLKDDTRRQDSEGRLKGIANYFNVASRSEE
ncbi:MAG: transglycosylase SLT domain-containing protein [Gammaproteobacteria bacterium]|nr:transglycosylase SLT domain-containing protein [Gammaproteobacteria bacterium]